MMVAHYRVSWHVCIIQIFISQEYKRGYIFTRYCRILGDIFQTIWTWPFNIIYIRGVDTRNGSIHIIKYISWKCLFIYAYISKATCYRRYFHRTCFDNRIYPRYIIYIIRNRRTVFNHTRESYNFSRHIFHLFCRSNRIFWNIQTRAYACSHVWLVIAKFCPNRYSLVLLQSLKKGWVVNKMLHNLAWNLYCFVERYS